MSILINYCNKNIKHSVAVFTKDNYAEFCETSLNYFTNSSELKVWINYFQEVCCQISLAVQLSHKVIM